MTRGIRGATTASENTREAIFSATAELLREMMAANAVAEADLASIHFSATPDLDAAFAATAAREVLGMTGVPLFGASEGAVAGAPVRCIRVLMLWNTDLGQSQVQHIYLREASKLRNDPNAI